MTSLLYRAVGIGATAIAMCASQLTAQTDSVFLVHGLKSDGPAWTTGKNILQGKFPSVFFAAPTNGWNEPFATQANNLIAAMNGSTSNQIAVGHSNGGTVLRTVAYNGHSLRAGVTLGSPQEGSALADNGVNGWVYSGLTDYWSNVTQAAWVYRGFHPDELIWWVSFWGDRYAIYYNAFLNSLVSYLGINTSTGIAKHDPGHDGRVRMG